MCPAHPPLSPEPAPSPAVSAVVGAWLPGLPAWSRLTLLQTGRLSTPTAGSLSGRDPGDLLDKEAERVGRTCVVLGTEPGFWAVLFGADAGDASHSVLPSSLPSSDVLSCTCLRAFAQTVSSARLGLAVSDMLPGQARVSPSQGSLVCISAQNVSLPPAQSIVWPRLRLLTSGS